MKYKILSVVTGCLLSFNAIATPKVTVPVIEYNPWSIIGGLGYTWYENSYHGGASADPTAQHAIGDGQTAFGRLAIARDIGAYNCTHFGVELGVQSGNTMRLNVPQTTLDLLGGAPIQVTTKPLLDLLLSVTSPALEQIPVFGVIKGGIASRRLEINDRVTVNDLAQVSFETQIGLGWHISDRASLALVYQGIFSGNTNFTVNTVNSTGHIANIPTQNGALLSCSYSL